MRFPVRNLLLSDTLEKACVISVHILILLFNAVWYFIILRRVCVYYYSINSVEEDLLNLQTSVCCALEFSLILQRKKKWRFAFYLKVIRECTLPIFDYHWMGRMTFAIGIRGIWRFFFHLRQYIMCESNYTVTVPN